MQNIISPDHVEVRSIMAADRPTRVYNTLFVDQDVGDSHLIRVEYFAHGKDGPALFMKCPYCQRHGHARPAFRVLASITKMRAGESTIETETFQCPNDGPFSGPHGGRCNFRAELIAPHDGFDRFPGPRGMVTINGLFRMN